MFLITEVVEDALSFMKIPLNFFHFFIVQILVVERQVETSLLLKFSLLSKVLKLLVCLYPRLLGTPPEAENLTDVNVSTPCFMETCLIRL